MAENERFTNGTIIDWLTWASRGILGALCAGMIATATWGLNAESRIAAVEKFDSRLARLEAKEDGYHVLATDLAVLKAQLLSQDKQLDHITALLEATR